MTSLEIVSVKKSIKDYINATVESKELARLIVKEILEEATKEALEEAILEAKVREEDGKDS